MQEAAEKEESATTSTQKKKTLQNLKKDNFSNPSENHLKENHQTLEDYCCSEETNINTEKSSVTTL